MSVLRFDPFSDPFRHFDRVTNQFLSGTRTPIGMAMDVWQADDGFHVALDLPGVNLDSLDITTERNILTVRAERQSEYQEGQGVLVAERAQGMFTRQLQLGDSVDVEKVQASYSNGVLHITIPLAQSAQPRRIQVQSRGGQELHQVTIEGEQTEQSEGAQGGSPAS